MLMFSFLYLQNLGSRGSPGLLASGAKTYYLAYCLQKYVFSLTIAIILVIIITVGSFLKFIHSVIYIGITYSSKCTSIQKHKHEKEATCIILALNICSIIGNAM